MSRDTFNIDGKDYPISEEQSDAIDALLDEFYQELEERFPDPLPGDIIGNMPDRRAPIRMKYEARIKDIVLNS